MRICAQDYPERLRASPQWRDGRFLDVLEQAVHLVFVAGGAVGEFFDLRFQDFEFSSPFSQLPTDRLEQGE